MIKYLVSSGVDIKKVRIIRQTEHMILRQGINGREIRERKRSEYMNYFDSWDEAKDFLVHKHTQIKDKAEAKLLNAKSALEQINKLIKE